MLEPCNVVKCLGHFNGIVPSLVCILDVFWRNNMASVVDIPLGNPWKWHFWDSKNFQNVPRCLALRNLPIWCEFQSCLLFIISLLLENFLTALDLSQSEMEKYFEWVIMLQRLVLACENIRFSSLFIAGDVSHGGTSATQQQKFNTDDVKSVQNPVRSADWLTQQLYFFSHCLWTTDKRQKAT